MDALMRIGFGLFGLAVLLGIAWLFSSNKKSVDWKLVGVRSLRPRSSRAASASSRACTRIARSLEEA